MTRALAVVSEDKLTQAVLHKCISVYLPSFKIVRSEVKNGRGNVQRELKAYEKLSAVMPVIIGVDLDGDVCAPALLASWANNYTPNPNLILRIAMREIESWVLADRKRVANLIGSTSDDIAKSPDMLADPKIELLTLARSTASEEIKSELVPVNFGQHPRIGPAYNLRMCKFVEKKWRPHVARTRSDSLKRAISAMQVLEASV